MAAPDSNALQSIPIGAFTVHCRLFCPRSSCTQYIIKFGDVVLGSQTSYPDESDCLWHARVACDRGRIDHATFKRIFAARSDHSLRLPKTTIISTLTPLARDYASGRIKGADARRKRPGSTQSSALSPQS
jgi:hypothetical protein